MSAQWSGNSLLGSVASRLASPLMMARRDGHEAFLRHLQIASTEFIYRFSEHDPIVTPYMFPKGRKRESETGKVTSMTTVEAFSLSATMSIDEGLPLQIALSFAMGENELENQNHLFELTVFRELLHHPRRYYAQVVLWTALIEKLEEMNFYHVMQTNITKLWEVVNDQQLQHGPDAFNGLRALKLSCDIVLFFSEHSLRMPPKPEVLWEFVTLSRQMWVDDIPLVVRRCAVVLSVFLAKYPSLLPLDEMCSCQMKPDAPHLLAVLAGVPALSEKSNDRPEMLRMALEVVFTTTVYSIPIATYFRDDGSSHSVLYLVEKHLASILYHLFATASGDFWHYFSNESLLSAVEAMATYACMWDSFPPGVQALQRSIYDHVMAQRSSICALSLFNFYTAASVSHYSLDDFRNCSGFFIDNTPEHVGDKVISSSEGVGAINEESGQPHDPCVSNMTAVTEFPVNKTFRLLMVRWNSMHSSDEVLMRSGLVLLQALLCNYPSQLREVEQLVGFDLQSLLHHVLNAALTERISDVRLVEVICEIVSQFHGMLGNMSYVASKLLLPSEMKEVGIRSEAVEVALLQLHLYDILLNAHTNTIRPGRMVGAVTHIKPGIISRHSLELMFFVCWLSTVQKTLVGASCSAASLISFKVSSEELIHRLSEGIFVFIRELKTGNVFLGDSSTFSHLQTAIHLLSRVVLEGGHHDSLATCVIATHGENTLSACLMLYSLLFASNATCDLVESTAKLLVYVVEHSQEKLFTTIRFHTTTSLKRRLLLAVHEQLTPPTSSFSSRTNVIRLACLRYLLRFDPASFYYLVVPEDTENSLELQLVRILRDVVGCRNSIPLEKAEALELLRALGDIGFSITNAVSLLESTECAPAYTACAFTAAVINYVCGIFLRELNADGDRTTRTPERWSHQGPPRSATCIVKGKMVASHMNEVKKMIRAGCEALRECFAFYKEMSSVFYSPSDYDESSFSTHRLSKVDSRQPPLSGTTTTVTMKNEVTSFVMPKSQKYGFPVAVAGGHALDEHVRTMPLLLGDGFLVPEREHSICLNRMASALESTTRLTTSLETLVWLVDGEREAFYEVLVLLEVVFDGIQMVEPMGYPLDELMYSCMNGWLSLARAITIVLSHASSGNVLASSTTRRIPFFHSILKLAAWNRENIDVVYQSIFVLSLFEPSDVADEELCIQIFELIADVLERNVTAAPSSLLSAFITEVIATYNRLRGFCPIRCLISTLGSLWSCAAHVLHLIPATEPSSPLSDFFDHVVDALCSALLHWDGAPQYFQPKPVMMLANALGQLTHSAFYDTSGNAYRPKAWHRAWQSVLRLLHTVLVSSDTEGSHRTEWSEAISSLATTSPRFRHAVSGFSLLDVPKQKTKMFSWELNEMHLCTSIIALLASFGVSTVAVTQCVRRCFCLIRRYNVQAIVTPDGVGTERSLGHLLVATVRLQLSYFIHQPIPQVYTEGDPILVTFDRYRTHTTGGNTPIVGSSMLSQNLDCSDEEGRREEEELSFDVLRTFVLRDLNIIRKSHRDHSRTACASFSPEQTPSLHSSFETASVDSMADGDIRETYSHSIGSHVDNVQLALSLFAHYTQFHINTRNLSIWERQELAMGLEKILISLGWLMHDVRSCENTRLSCVVETIRVELQVLAERLRGGL